MFGAFWSVGAWMTWVWTGSTLPCRSQERNFTVVEVFDPLTLKGPEYVGLDSGGSDPAGVKFLSPDREPGHRE